MEDVPTTSAEIADSPAPSDAPATAMPKRRPTAKRTSPAAATRAPAVVDSAPTLPNRTPAKQTKAKPTPAKPSSAKPATAKAAPAKPVEPKHVEPKHVEPKHVEPKHVEPKHVEPKHVEPEHVEPKPAGAKPAPTKSKAAPAATAPADAPLEQLDILTELGHVPVQQSAPVRATSAPTPTAATSPAPPATPAPTAESRLSWGAYQQMDPWVPRPPATPRTTPRLPAPRPTTPERLTPGRPAELARAAVRRYGPAAQDWADRTRSRYPAASAAGLARLATIEVLAAARRQSAAGGLTAATPGAAAWAGVIAADVAVAGALATQQARLALMIAAAYGLDPTVEERVRDLLWLSGADRPRTALTALARTVAQLGVRRVAALAMPFGAAAAGYVNAERELSGWARRAQERFR